MSAAPVVVLSFDFELRWGLADRLAGDFDRYRRNLEGVRDAVPALLELFARREIPATWATVGAVACEDWEDYRASAPIAPRYRDPRLVHDVAAYEAADPSGRLHFAPELVRAIANAPWQELGSHTFTHVFVREPGVMQRDVAADALAVRALFERRFGITPKSLVFPRNQVAFVDLLSRHGIDVVRGNAEVWYHEQTSETEESSLVRSFRLLEAFAPIGARTYPAAGRIQRASYFMRLGLPAPAFAVHRRRICADARRMEPGDALHLWAHPHNFGDDPRATVARLDELLDAVRASRPDVRFASMGGLGAH